MAVVALDRAPLRVPMVLTDPAAAIPGVRRLAELGLRGGARIRVLSRTSGGGRLVAVAGSRIALDRRTAALLQVVVPEPVVPLEQVAASQSARGPA